MWVIAHPCVSACQRDSLGVVEEARVPQVVKAPLVSVEETSVRAIKTVQAVGEEDENENEEKKKKEEEEKKENKKDTHPSTTFLEAWECTMSSSTSRPRPCASSTNLFNSSGVP